MYPEEVGMKHNWIVLALMACLLVSVSACASETRNTTENIETQTHMVSGHAPEQDTTEDTSGNTNTDHILATAEAYRDIYTGVYSGNQTAVMLTDKTMTEILSRLGTQGLVAIDFSNRFPMENANLVVQFFKDMDAEVDAHVTIYQICWDGGFICHDLTYANGKTTVVLTSLAWLSEGPYALTGDIPTIRYSNEYAVTDICYSADGYLEYEYDMPDNPPGSNHDGHIDTTYQLAVSVS